MRVGTERNRRGKGWQNPFGHGVGWHDFRAYLDDEPCNHRIAGRDAIDLPLFQLTEERFHLGPRRLRSIGFFSHHVEPRFGHASLTARGVRP